MRVKNGDVVFEWSEAGKYLPPQIANHGYTVMAILGQNANLEFKLGNDRIVFVTDERDIHIKVIPYLGHSYQSLSELIAACEQILQKATEEGVFSELETAVTVAVMLNSYFERIAQRVVQRSTSDLWAAIRSLQSQLTQKQ
jgi:uncharacterized protein YqgV (UPF0045/DUF77 family)